VTFFSQGGCVISKIFCRFFSFLVVVLVAYVGDVVCLVGCIALSFGVWLRLLFFVGTLHHCNT